MGERVHTASRLRLPLGRPPGSVAARARGAASGNPARRPRAISRPHRARLKGNWAHEHAATLKAVIREASCPTMVAHI